MKKIGSTFSAELKAAGVNADGVSWGDDGEISFSESVSQSTIDAVNAAYAAHDPNVAAETDVRRSYEATAQSLLDTTAQSWGYDSLLSAASYVNSSVTRFKAEADTLVAWRDSLWQAAYAIEVSVQGGAPMPATAAAFIALLPAQPTRPTA